MWSLHFVFLVWAAYFLQKLFTNTYFICNFALKKNYDP